MAQTQIPDGPTLVLLAAVVSLQLAQGRSKDDVALMGIFLTTLGDNLSLLSTAMPQDI